MRKWILFLLAVTSMVSCKQKDASSNVETPKHVIETAQYNESFRPQFHFTPSEKWMNDPNGLVYHEGIYHLFYQYYPDDIVWGPMHWGHATSTDMIHWEHKPIALYPDEHGLIFSGSAVVDTHNSSGFGTNENPPLVAMFTYHSMELEKLGNNDYQTQGIAYSLDNGDTWTKYEGNPVIGNNGIKDFRDPKVFWHEASSRWVLTLVAGDHAKFYSSKNLKEWTYLSEFGKDIGAHGGVWECPDLFELKVNDREESKWVLLISINPGAPNGGSGTQYFVGDFDGITFTTNQEDIKWIDYGMDNYAGVTYNNTPNKDRIFIGWMSNWEYARDTPTEKWRSAMTLPRTISLHQDASGYYMKNYPLPQLQVIETAIEFPEVIPLQAEFVWSGESLMQTDLNFSADLSKALTITLGNETENVTLALNPASKEMSFDRSHSGIVDFKEKFANSAQTQPYLPEEKEVEMRVIVDQSSVEVFIDQGRYVFTNQIFPTKPYQQIKIQGEGQQLNNVELSQLNSIWNEK